MQRQLKALNQCRAVAFWELTRILDDARLEQAVGAGEQIDLCDTEALGPHIKVRHFTLLLLEVIPAQPSTKIMRLKVAPINGVLATLQSFIPQFWTILSSSGNQVLSGSLGLGCSLCKSRPFVF